MVSPTGSTPRYASNRNSEFATRFLGPSRLSRNQKLATTFIKQLLRQGYPRRKEIPEAAYGKIKALDHSNLLRLRAADEVLEAAPRDDYLAWLAVARVGGLASLLLLDENSTELLARYRATAQNLTPASWATVAARHAQLRPLLVFLEAVAHGTDPALGTTDASSGHFYRAIIAPILATVAAEGITQLHKAIRVLSVGQGLRYGAKVSPLQHLCEHFDLSAPAAAIDGVDPNGEPADTARQASFPAASPVQNLSPLQLPPSTRTPTPTQPSPAPPPAMSTIGRPVHGASTPSNLDLAGAAPRPDLGHAFVLAEVLPAPGLTLAGAMAQQDDDVFGPAADPQLPVVISGQQVLISAHMLRALLDS